jgi:hypothetical protein
MTALRFALLASATVAFLSLPHPRGASAAEPPACLSAVRRQLPLTDRAGCPLAFAAGAGYGYTGAVLGLGDTHHRLLGAFAAEWTAHPAWVLGLRLDGRYDRHAVTAVAEEGSGDDGWTGEPRLTARWQRALNGDPTRVGVGLAVNLPGGAAPSIDLHAIGGELALLATRPLGPLELTGRLGYRLDRTANAVPEAARLSPADRVGLGVNAFDAVLVGLGGEHRAQRLALFAEATLDVLVGAPSAAVWPLRLGAGARRFVAQQLAVEMLVEATLSSRPRVGPRDPLVEVPPRVAVLAGLAWGRGEPARLPAPPPPPPPPAAPDASEPRPRGQLRGSVRSYGGRGIAATINITGGPTPILLESRAGDFEVDLSPGTYEVSIEAPAFVPQKRRVVIEENGVILLNVDLRRAP